MWDSAFFFENVLPRVVGAVPLTLLITLLSGAISVTLGYGLAAISVSRFRVGAWVSSGLQRVVRGTPLIIQLFAVYYLLPAVGIVIDAFATALMVLGVHYACFLAGSYEKGIRSIPAHLLESCLALGLSIPHAWRRVVIPLSLRVSVPSTMNYLILIFKQTALLFAIGIPVILGAAQSIGYEHFRYLEAYTAAGLIYLVITATASALVRRLERNGVFD